MKIKLANRRAFRIKSRCCSSTPLRKDLIFTRSIRMRIIPASTGTVRHSTRCCKPQANINLMWYWPKRNPVLPVTWNSWKNICTESSWSGGSASLQSLTMWIRMIPRTRSPDRSMVSSMSGIWKICPPMSARCLTTSGKRDCSSALLHFTAIAKIRRQRESS